MDSQERLEASKDKQFEIRKNEIWQLVSERFGNNEIFERRLSNIQRNRLVLFPSSSPLTDIVLEKLKDCSSIEDATQILSGFNAEGNQILFEQMIVYYKNAERMLNVASSQVAGFFEAYDEVVNHRGLGNHDIRVMKENMDAIHKLLLHIQAIRKEP